MRFSSSVALLCLAACNEIYDLDSTHLPTRHVGCPPIGETPRYSTGLAQLAFEPCTQFHVSGTHAVARCFVDRYIGVFVGDADGALTHPAELPVDVLLSLDPVHFDSYQTPFPTVDGGRVHMTHIEQVGIITTFELVVFTLANGAWSRTPALDRAITTDALMGVIDTPTGDRVITLSAVDAMEQIVEWQFTDAWHVVRTTRASELGIGHINKITFTSDGLRALVLVPDA
ncbi:MAG TPA: hypothetical protein VL856_19545, partial [Acidimicrobiia bacterium]|nr:hypothetical protein [Acidimicrobiia bacterium]